MNKIFLCVVLAIGSNMAVANNTITFNGEITSATCLAKIGGQSDATVTLPTISTNAFTGETAGRTQFNIDVSGCQNATGKTVAAFFEPDATNVDAATGLLNNVAPASPTPAGNVKMQLLDGANGNAIKVGYQDQAATGGTTFNAISESNAATLIYFVEYKKAVTADAVTAGPVVSRVVYNLMYK
ncbi:fimbrial protein [Citrobacter amalonaticus]|uniref:fimbrial protein n=1 Tax=Citrobacter amalonaticus TaxID=35703 RepID=UPI00339C23F4